MGAKITVDCATLMNKALELIEASLLFDLPADRIGVLVHPSSTIHALVELRDGCLLAQMAAPDMRQPILYALGYPERPESSFGRLDLASPLRLELEPLDERRFDAVALAREALEQGGSAPLALNAADEVAVGAFLAGRVAFDRIVPLAAEVLRSGPWPAAADYPALVEADRRARSLAEGRLQTPASRS
jgi:1-deoxy-D-xylulose-5-phosphate reductoisomerase